MELPPGLCPAAFESWIPGDYCFCASAAVRAARGVLTMTFGVAR
jgi:hypothetical protein